MTAIICLGYSFGNEKRLKNLKLRTEKSVELYKEGRGSKIIFTGGFSSPIDLSEAEQMSEIARALGAPHEDIILEEKATTTVSNAICTKKILEDQGFESAIIVTSPTHFRRAKYVFSKIIPDKHLEFVKSKNHARLLRLALEYLIEVLKLGEDSILLSRNIRKTNFIEA